MQRWAAGLCVVVALAAPAGAIEAPICQFAVNRECAPVATQCHRDVALAHESPAVQDAEHAACDAKAMACAERMRKPAAECAALAATLDATLRAMDNPPRRPGP